MKHLSTMKHINPMKYINTMKHIITISYRKSLICALTALLTLCGVSPSFARVFEKGERIYVNGTPSSLDGWSTKWKDDCELWCKLIDGGTEYWIKVSGWSTSTVYYFEIPEGAARNWNKIKLGRYNWGANPAYDGENAKKFNLTGEMWIDGEKNYIENFAYDDGWTGSYWAQYIFGPPSDANPSSGKITVDGREISEEFVEFCPESTGDPFSLTPIFDEGGTDYNYGRSSCHAWYKWDGSSWGLVTGQYAGYKGNGENEWFCNEKLSEASDTYYFLWTNAPSRRRLVHLKRKSSCLEACNITSFRYVTTPVNVNDSTFAFEGSVAFTKAAGNLKISFGSAAELIITDPQSPQVFSLPELKADGRTDHLIAQFLDEGSCMADSVATAPTPEYGIMKYDSKDDSEHYSPSQKTYGHGTDVTLIPSTLVTDSFTWMDVKGEIKKSNLSGGDNTYSISGFGHDTTIVFYYTEFNQPPVVEDNMMDNGSYESVTADFDLMSDYAYTKRVESETYIIWDGESDIANGIDDKRKNVYWFKTGCGWNDREGKDTCYYHGRNGLFGVTVNPNVFWERMAYINPKEGAGTYMAVFDGDSGEKIAWQAKTSENPNLRLQKGTTYMFSFWVANVNNFGEMINFLPDGRRMTNNAILQFKIKYKYKENGVDKEKTEFLGEETDLNETKYLNNSWHQNSATFTSPVDADEVIISVVDKNETGMRIGNDFALDDIRFRAVSVQLATVRTRERFEVKYVEPETNPVNLQVSFSEPKCGEENCTATVKFRYPIVTMHDIFLKLTDETAGGYGILVASEKLTRTPVVEGTDSADYTGTFTVKADAKEHTFHVKLAVKDAKDIDHGGEISKTVTSPIVPWMQFEKDPTFEDYNCSDSTYTLLVPVRYLKQRGDMRAWLDAATYDAAIAADKPISDGYKIDGDYEEYTKNSGDTLKTLIKFTLQHGDGMSHKVYVECLDEKDCKLVGDDALSFTAPYRPVIDKIEKEFVPLEFGDMTYSVNVKVYTKNYKKNGIPATLTVWSDDLKDKNGVALASQSSSAPIGCVYSFTFTDVKVEHGATKHFKAHFDDLPTAECVKELEFTSPDQREFLEFSGTPSSVDCNGKYSVDFVVKAAELGGHLVIKHKGTVVYDEAQSTVSPVSKEISGTTTVLLDAPASAVADTLFAIFTSPTTYTRTDTMAIYTAPAKPTIGMIGETASAPDCKGTVSKILKVTITNQNSEAYLVVMEKGTPDKEITNIQVKDISTIPYPVTWNYPADGATHQACAYVSDRPECQTPIISESAPSAPTWEYTRHHSNIDCDGNYTDTLYFAWNDGMPGDLVIQTPAGGAIHTESHASLQYKYVTSSLNISNNNDPLIKVHFSGQSGCDSIIPQKSPILPTMTITHKQSGVSCDGKYNDTIYFALTGQQGDLVLKDENNALLHTETNVGASYTYVWENLAANGAEHTLKANMSKGWDCVKTLTFNAPNNPTLTYSLGSQPIDCDDNVTQRVTLSFTYQTGDLVIEDSKGNKLTTFTTPTTDQTYDWKYPANGKNDTIYAYFTSKPTCKLQIVTTAPNAGTWSYTQRVSLPDCDGLYNDSIFFVWDNYISGDLVVHNMSDVVIPTKSHAALKDAIVISGLRVSDGVQAVCTAWFSGRETCKTPITATPPEGRSIAAAHKSFSEISCDGKVNDTIVFTITNPIGNLVITKENGDLLHTELSVGTSFTYALTNLDADGSTTKIKYHLSEGLDCEKTYSQVKPHNPTLSYSLGSQPIDCDDNVTQRVTLSFTYQTGDLVIEDSKGNKLTTFTTPTTDQTYDWKYPANGKNDTIYAYFTSKPTCKLQIVTTAPNAGTWSYTQRVSLPDCDGLYNDSIFFVWDNYISGDLVVHNMSDVVIPTKSHAALKDAIVISGLRVSDGVQAVCTAWFSGRETCKTPITATPPEGRSIAAAHKSFSEISCDGKVNDTIVFTITNPIGNLVITKENGDLLHTELSVGTSFTYALTNLDADGSTTKIKYHLSEGLDCEKTYSQVKPHNPTLSMESLADQLTIDCNGNVHLPLKVTFANQTSALVIRNNAGHVIDSIPASSVGTSLKTIMWSYPAGESTASLKAYAYFSDRMHCTTELVDAEYKAGVPSWGYDRTTHVECDGSYTDTLLFTWNDAVSDLYIDSIGSNTRHKYTTSTGSKTLLLHGDVTDTPREVYKVYFVNNAGVCDSIIHTIVPQVSVLTGFAAEKQEVACDANEYTIKATWSYRKAVDSLYIVEEGYGIIWRDSAKTAQPVVITRPLDLDNLGKEHKFYAYFRDRGVVCKSEDVTINEPIVPHIDTLGVHYIVPVCNETTASLVFDLHYTKQQDKLHVALNGTEQTDTIMDRGLKLNYDRDTLVQITIPNLKAHGDVDTLRVWFDGDNSCDKTYILPTAPFSPRITNVKVDTVTDAICDVDDVTLVVSYDVENGQNATATIESKGVSVARSVTDGHYTDTLRNVLRTYQDKTDDTVMVSIPATYCIAVQTATYTQLPMPEVTDVNVMPVAPSCDIDTFTLYFDMSYTYQLGDLTVWLDSMTVDKALYSKTITTSQLSTSAIALHDSLVGLPSDGSKDHVLHFLFDGEHACSGESDLFDFPNTPLIDTIIITGVPDLVPDENDPYQPTIKVAYERAKGQKIILEYFDKGDVAHRDTSNVLTADKDTCIFTGIDFNDVAVAGDRKVNAYFEGAAFGDCHEGGTHTAIYRAPSNSSIEFITSELINTSTCNTLRYNLKGAVQFVGSAVGDLIVELDGTTFKTKILEADCTPNTPLPFEIKNVTAAIPTEGKQLKAYFSGIPGNPTYSTEVHHQPVIPTVKVENATYATPQCNESVTSLTFDLKYIKQQGNLHLFLDGVVCYDYTIQTGAPLSHDDDTEQTATIVIEDLPADLSVRDLWVWFDGATDCNPNFTMPQAPYSPKVTSAKAEMSDVACDKDTYTLNVSFTVENSHGKDATLVFRGESVNVSTTDGTNYSHSFNNVARTYGDVTDDVVELSFAGNDADCSGALYSIAYTETPKPAISLTLAADQGTTTCSDRTYRLQGEIRYTYLDQTPEIWLDEEAHRAINVQTMQADEQVINLDDLINVPADGREHHVYIKPNGWTDACAIDVPFNALQQPVITAAEVSGVPEYISCGETYSATVTVDYVHAFGKTITVACTDNGSIQTYTSAAITDNDGQTVITLPSLSDHDGVTALSIYIDDETCAYTSASITQPKLNTIEPDFAVNVSATPCGVVDYAVWGTIKFNNAAGLGELIVKTEDGVQADVTIKTATSAEFRIEHYTVTGTAMQLTAYFENAATCSVLSAPFDSPDVPDLTLDDTAVDTVFTCGDKSYTVRVAFTATNQSGTGYVLDSIANGAVRTVETINATATAAQFVIARPAKEEQHFVVVRYPATGCEVISQALDINPYTKPKPLISLTAIDRLCNNETELILPLVITQGDIDEATLTLTNSKGEKVITAADMSINTAHDTLSYNLPTQLAAGKYTATVDARDTLGCETSAAQSVEFAIDGVVFSKWTDVLLVDNEGGLFTGYQWYENDKLLEGKTDQVLYLPEGMSGKSYYCVLQTAEGAIYTCVSDFGELPRSADNPKTQSANHITVLPNRVATNGAVTVHQSMDENLHLILMSATGKRVAEYTQQEATKLIDMPGVQGIYLLRIESDSDVQTVKIVVY